MASWTEHLLPAGYTITAGVAPDESGFIRMVERPEIGQIVRHGLPVSYGPYTIDRRFAVSHEVIATIAVAVLETEFAAGTFNVDIAVASGATIFGQGPNRTIIQPQTSGAAINIDGLSDVTFRNLTLKNFSLVKFAGTCSRIRFQNVKFDGGVYGLSWTSSISSILAEPGIVIDGLIITGCEFTGMSAAMRLDVVLQNCQIVGNHVHDVGGAGRINGGFYAGLDGAGISDEVFLSQGSLIATNNIVSNANCSTKTGDSTTGNSYELFGFHLKGRRVVVANNVIKNVQGVVYDNEAIYTKATQVVVSGNIIENSGSLEAAINIKGNSPKGAASIVEPDGRKYVVTDNIITFTEYTVDGQALQRGGIQLSNEQCVCSGNQIHGPNNFGIQVQGETGGESDYDDMVVTDNIITGCTGRFGIILRGGHRFLTLSQNIIDDIVYTSEDEVQVAGIFLESVPGRIKSYEFVDIVGNTVSIAAGTVVNSSSYVAPITIMFECPWIAGRIARNTLRNDATATLKYAILFKDDRASNVVEQMDINDNILIGAQQVRFEPNCAPKYLNMRQMFRGQTTDNTTLTLVVMPVREGAVLSLEALTVASAIAGTDSAAYRRAALFSRYTASDPVQVGTTQSLMTIEDVAGAWSQTFDVNAGLVRTRVNGDTSQTVNWNVLLTAISSA